MPAPWIRSTALAGVLLVALGACTDDGTPPAQADPTSQASTPAPEPTTAEPPPKPAAPPSPGRCYRLTQQTIASPSDTSTAVRCAQSHTSQTYAVGRMPAAVVGSTEDPDATAIAEHVIPRCDRRLARWTGGTREVRLLSRLHAVWFVPTTEDLALGARWFRCDVVAYAAQTRLAELPASTEGLLDVGDALDRVGLCSRGSPEDPDSIPVTCDRPHGWRAFTVQPLAPGPGGGYPLRSELSAARTACSDSVREQLGFPLEWTYGWQPPSRASWDDGLRHGFCWIQST